MLGFAKSKPTSICTFKLNIPMRLCFENSVLCVLSLNYL